MADADNVKKKYPEMSAPIIELDLEAEIARAEQAVITRDLRIRHRAEMIYHRGKREAVRHAGAGLAVGIGTVLLTWWLNHLSHRNDPPPEAVAKVSPETASHFTFESLFRDAAIMLASLLPMVWPMLPRPWRRTVSPNTAGAVLTWLAPLMGKLFKRKPKIRVA